MAGYYLQLKFMKRFKIFFFYRLYTTQISMQTKAKKGSWETLISSIAMIIFLYAQVESDNAFHWRK